MPTSTNFGYLLYCTRVQAMPRPEEGAPPEHDNTPITSSEIISPDSTFAIYEEALAETRTIVRDEAKEVIKARIREVEQMRTTLARAETELAKLLKKTPEEIASTAYYKRDEFGRKIPY
jgi:hypothetical protein